MFSGKDLHTCDFCDYQYKLLNLSRFEKSLVRLEIYYSEYRLGTLVQSKRNRTALRVVYPNSGKKLETPYIQSLVLCRNNERNSKWDPIGTKLVRVLAPSRSRRNLQVLAGQQSRVLENFRLVAKLK